MHAESAYIGLGSNLGDRTAHLLAGLDGLRAAGLSIGPVSSLYLTEPEIVPSRDHPWYVNCVAAVDGADDPASLLRACLDVEESGGRRRAGAASRPDGETSIPEPRTLDLDVLLFGDAVLDEAALTIPHPRMHRRRFVLQPLSEIAPGVVHPRAKATAAELLRKLPRSEGVWLLAPFPAA